MSESCVHRAQLTGLSAPLFLPLSCSSPLPVVLPAPTFFCHLICCPTLFLLPHNRQHTWDLWPSLLSHSCPAPLIAFSAPCRFRRLVRGPRGPSGELPGSDEPPPHLTVTSDIRHLAVPHTHAQQWSSKHSLQRSILKWEQTRNTLTNQHRIHSYFSFSLPLEKNKSCPHRCHQSERTNGALTCQRRWGVCRRKEKMGWDEGRKGVREVWEKSLTGAGAVSIFMRTGFSSTSIYLSAVASA